MKLVYLRNDDVVYAVFCTAKDIVSTHNADASAVQRVRICVLKDFAIGSPSGLQWVVGNNDAVACEVDCEPMAEVAISPLFIVSHNARAVPFVTLYSSDSG